MEECVMPRRARFRRSLFGIALRKRGKRQKTQGFVLCVRLSLRRREPGERVPFGQADFWTEPPQAHTGKLAALRRSNARVFRG